MGLARSCARLTGRAALGVAVAAAAVATLPAGCRHAPDWGPTRGRLVRRELASGGRMRSFVSFTPGAPSPSGGPAGVGRRLLPLLLALHGRYGDGAGQDDLSGLSALAERKGFLLVLPDGWHRSWNDGRGSSPASKEGVDDVGFLRDLIALEVREHGADPERVYVAGMSNGAMMALAAACALADRVAAVLSVTGTMSAALSGGCRPSRPISVAFILGDRDPVVPYAGGEVARDRGAMLSAAASRDFWRARDGCDARLDEGLLPDADPADGTRVAFSRTVDGGCRAGTEVALYTVRGGGHTWPGGWQYLGEGIVGKTSRDVSASALGWEFFARHRLARP